MITFLDYLIQKGVEATLLAAPGSAQEFHRKSFENQTGVDGLLLRTTSGLFRHLRP